MSTTDIRVGDLVKATSKARPEEYTVYRVTSVGKNWVDGAIMIADRNAHVFEVLDRPLPPISAELLFGAVDAYRKADGIRSETQDYHTRADYYGDAVTAVINFVREHDKNNTKENA